MARYFESLLKSACGWTVPILDMDLKYPVRADSQSGDVFFTLHHTFPMRDLDDPVDFYVRPALKEHIDALHSHRVGLLQGRPGVGKSLFLWWYALTYAKENPSTRVIWLDDFSGLYTILHNNRLQTFCGKYLSFFLRPDDFFVIDAIESAARYYVLYRDYGVTLERTGHFYLIVSDAVDVKYEWLEDRGGFCDKLPHWTLEEYKRACDFPPFFDSVKASLQALTRSSIELLDNPNLTMQTLLGEPDCMSTPSLDEAVEPDYAVAAVRNELIDRKYFYAGHSVRYMFGRTYAVETIVRHILSYVGRLYFFVFAPESDSDSRIHLYFDHSSDARGHCVTVPVSQFALRAMCDNMGMESLAATSSHSPSLEEQVLKIDVEKALQRGQMNLRCNQVVQGVQVVGRKTSSADGGYMLSPKTATDFLVTRGQHFENELCVPQLDYYANTCFYPNAKLPGAFDFVQLLSRQSEDGDERLVLRFLQVTRGSVDCTNRVTLRLDLMTRFAVAFNEARDATTVPPPVTFFEVAIITTANRALEYKTNKPILIGELAGWEDSQLQVFSFTRAHEVKTKESKSHEHPCW